MEKCFFFVVFSVVEHSLFLRVMYFALIFKRMRHLSIRASTVIFGSSYGFIFILLVFCCFFKFNYVSATKYVFNFFILLLRMQLCKKVLDN